MPSYLPDFMQQALKPLARLAGTWIVAAKLFKQLDVTTANAALTPLDARLAGEAAPAL